MISAILLAAGQSKRMKGKNKLMEKIKGVPLIKHSVKNILDSTVDELIVVLGYENELIKKLIGENLKTKFIFNKDFESGMASSIKLGLDHLSDKAEAFFICLGDMPMVNKEIYNQLIKSMNEKELRETKSLLAKLMATENIRVEHNGHLSNFQKKLQKDKLLHNLGLNI